MNKNTPMLFEVNIPDTCEIKATKFISHLQRSGFVDTNIVYLKNYINADMAIAFSHIKTSYKSYVIEGEWPEDKFEDIIYIIAKHRKMLTSHAFLKYGIMYDNGELTKEVKLEKKKCDKFIKKEDKRISDEEQELIDYIANNGGR